MNPMDLKRGIDLAVGKVGRGPQERSKDVSGSNEIAQVGIISANGDREVGEKIAEAMEKVGKEGVITVEEAKGPRVRARRGRGHAVRPRLPVALTSSPIPRRCRSSLTDPYILIHEKKLGNLQAMLRSSRRSSRAAVRC
jgi:chaperonin GroEL